MEPPKSRVRLALAAGGLALYGVVVLFAAFWPTPIDRDYQSSVSKVLDVLHRHGLPGWFGYSKLEFTANVGMFIPLAFLVTLVLPARLWWLVLLICPGLSVIIEVTQGLLLSERFATPWDVLANTTGSLIGTIIALVLRSLVHRRDDIMRARWARTIRTVG
jgi:VanZ family protein